MSLNTVYVAPLPSKLTPVAPVKAVPVIVTTVPPASGPLAGSRLSIVGVAGGTYVNSAWALPLGVCTSTTTVPLPAGDTA